MGGLSSRGSRAYSRFRRAVPPSRVASKRTAVSGLAPPDADLAKDRTQVLALLNPRNTSGLAMPYWWPLARSPDALTRGGNRWLTTEKCVLPELSRLSQNRLRAGLGAVIRCG